MSVFHAFFRAQKETPGEEARNIPWPDIPVPVAGAVIVGEPFGQSPNKIWQVMLFDPDDFATLQSLPGYLASSYNQLRGRSNGPDVFEAVIEEDDPQAPGQKRRRRVKMRNKPSTGVIQEDVIPHQFFGAHA